MGHNRKNMSAYQAKIKKESQKKAQKRKQVLIALASALALIALVAVLVAVHQIRMRPKKVVMEVEGYGTITMELYPRYAPKTVKAITEYVEKGFYDGLTFHRCIEGFMIQGGDPSGTGAGDPGLATIPGEFSANGYTNDLSFQRGVIGLARSQDPDSGSSQFFICHKDSLFLDGNYAAFGRVIAGMDVVDAIATCEKTEVIDASGYHYQPKNSVIIHRMYLAED